MIFFCISLSTYFCYLVLKTFKFLNVLDKEKFNISKYFKWIKDHSKKIFLTPELFALILMIIAFNSDAKITGICMIIFYMIMFLYMLFKDKEKGKLTGNVIRSFIITFVIYFLIVIACMVHYNYSQSGYIIFDDRWLYYTVLLGAMYFNCFIALLSGVLNNVIMVIVGKITKRSSNKSN